MHINQMGSDKLWEELDPVLAKAVMRELLENYSQPAFGSLPKKEIDLMMFQALQKLGILESQPDLYSIVSTLKVTRAKARNLLYEVGLRNSDAQYLDSELRRHLARPMGIKDGEKICLEMGNPLLIDHLKHILRKLGHLSDGSFSPELVRLQPVALKALLNHLFETQSKEILDQALIDSGLKTKVDISSLMSGVLSKIGAKAMDKVGAEMGSALGVKVGDYLAEFFGAGEKA